MSLPTVLLADRLTAGDPDPAERITVTIGDKTFDAGRRTAAHLEWTIAELAREHPGAHLHVMQSCFHEGYEPSAGTHDGDGVLDVEIVGLDWVTGQSFVRRCGWAGWWRHTGSWAARSDWHIHMASIGCPGRVGYYVPGQIDDYYRHAEGLAREHTSGLDHSWFPAEIDSTVFDYPAYLKGLPEMNDAEWKRLDDLLDGKLLAQRKSIVTDLLAAAVDKAGTSLRAAVRKAAGLH